MSLQRILKIVAPDVYSVFSLIISVVFGRDEMNALQKKKKKKHTNSNSVIFMS